MDLLSIILEAYFTFCAALLFYFVPKFIPMSKNLFHQIEIYKYAMMPIAAVPGLLIFDHLPFVFFFIPFGVSSAITIWKFVANRNKTSHEWKPFYYATFGSLCSVLVIIATTVALLLPYAPQ